MYTTIKTYEDACRKLGMKEKVPDVSTFPEKNQASVMAYHQLTIIAEAVNDGWKPDWNDFDQYKYVPWFEEKSGFGLSFGDYVLWHSRTGVGSRLCYKSREIAEYVATTFAELYRDFLTL